MEVTMTVNGERVTRDVEPRLLLVHFLRETLDLTGTHWGCDTSNCGACVVQVDGQPVKSCTMLAVMCDGHEVRTVEALCEKQPTEELFAEAGRLAAEACSPVEDQRGLVDYKRHLADELTRRVLRRALERVGATATAA